MISLKNTRKPKVVLAKCSPSRNLASLTYKYTVGYTIQEKINNDNSEKKKYIFCTETVGRHSVYWLEQTLGMLGLYYFTTTHCVKEVQNIIFVFHVSCVLRTLHWMRSECTGNSHKNPGMVMEMVGM